MHRAFTTALSLLVATLAACASPADAEGIAADESAIKGAGASEAQDDWVVVVNGCSGALIAPRVVLTAGHCVAGSTQWNVTAPYQNAHATTNDAETYDYEGTDDAVHPDQHDIALVYLSKPLEGLSGFPEISDAPVANGTKVIAIGRVREGVVSQHTLFESRPVAVKRSRDLPFAYSATDVLEPGDSGGPVIVRDGDLVAHIVGVSSGHGGNVAYFARTDLLHRWLQERIAAHGG